MQTKKYAARKPKAKAIDLRKAIAATTWKTVRAFAAHIGCHENTLHVACRENRLPRNALIRSLVARELALGSGGKP